eukprot:TRINITY_DN8646_c0_g1_i1.p1 TRINITY_DN8646_c0_g1~~TRINITY_DN8646_c0_g1_i1.p1  ORF type:complete len:157 (+),score=40.24 TRINITY_DN8646_c0_g1_i1:379-849(+)
MEEEGITEAQSAEDGLKKVLQSLKEKIGQGSEKCLQDMELCNQEMAKTKKECEELKNMVKDRDSQIAEQNKTMTELNSKYLKRIEDLSNEKSELEGCMEKAKDEYLALISTAPLTSQEDKIYIIAELLLVEPQELDAIRKKRGPMGSGRKKQTTLA